MNKGKGKGKTSFFECEECLEFVPGCSFIECACGFEQCIKCVQKCPGAKCPECKSIFDMEMIFERMSNEWIDTEYMDALDEYLYSSIFLGAERTELELLLMADDKRSIYQEYLKNIDSYSPTFIICPYPMCKGHVRKDKDWVCVLCKESSCKYCHQPKYPYHKCNKEHLEPLVELITTYLPCIRCKNYNQPPTSGAVMKCSTQGCNITTYNERRNKKKITKPLFKQRLRIPKNASREQEYLIQTACNRIREIHKVKEAYSYPKNKSLELKLQCLQGKLTKYKFKSLYYPEYINEFVSSKIASTLEWLCRTFNLAISYFKGGDGVEEPESVEEFLKRLEDTRNTFNDKMYHIECIFGVKKYPYLAREWLLWTDVTRYISPMNAEGYNKLLLPELKSLFNAIHVTCDKRWKKADIVEYLSREYPNGIRARDVVKNIKPI